MSRYLNPYIAGNPVGNSNAFIGRADVVRDVLHIFARPEENAIVLYGQRRIGKTSVLQFLQKNLRQETTTGHYLPIYFDLQDKATYTLGNVLKELANTIAYELDLPTPQLGDNPEHSFQHQWLPQQLANLAKGTALVLLFDEFDVLAAESAKGASADFFPYLRQLLASDRQRLNFVFVIGRNVDDLNTIALSLFKSVPARRISLLNKTDTFDLIRLSEKTSPLRWSVAALERIWQLTNGHAFFTQQLCSFAWEETYNDGKTNPEEITANSIDKVIEDVLSASKNAFEWLWDGLPPAERVVSAALAQAGGHAVTETELDKLLHESGVRIVIRELQDAPKLLQDWDLLEPVDGGYRFKVELLRRWIETNKPLRRVQDELDRIEPVAENLFQAAHGMYRNSQLELAENLLNQALGLNPNHVKANKLLADLLLANGNYTDAKNVLANLYEFQPYEARSRLVQAYLGLASATQDDEEKLSYLDEILKIDANQPEAKKIYKAIWTKRGEGYLTDGLSTEALAAFTNAGLNKKVAELKQALYDEEGKQQLQVLETLKQEKNYADALALISQLETSHPTLFDWQQEQRVVEQLQGLTSNYRLAMDALTLGNNKQAQELLLAVMGVDPNFEEAAYYLYLAVTGNDYYLLNQNLQKLDEENKLLQAEMAIATNQFENETRNLFEENDALAQKLTDSVGLTIKTEGMLKVANSKLVEKKFKLNSLYEKNNRLNITIEERKQEAEKKIDLLIKENTELLIAKKKIDLLIKANTELQLIADESKKWSASGLFSILCIISFIIFILYDQKAAPFYNVIISTSALIWLFVSKPIKRDFGATSIFIISVGGYLFLVLISLLKAF